MILFLLKGIGIGFSIAAPVGPIGVLCISRTITHGRISGLITGLGAATADAAYGCIAGFGLAYVSNYLVHQHVWLQIIGGLFLVCLGLYTFAKEPASDNSPPDRNQLLGHYMSALALTLTNPMTILSFAAVFAGLGLGNTGGDYQGALALVVGVFSGSMLWWFILSSGVNMLGRRFRSKVLLAVNKGAGIVIAAFGIVALVSGMY